MEIWAHARPVIAIPRRAIDRVSVTTVVTSRPVPAMAFSGEVGTVELVPGRPGWELFPQLDAALVQAEGERLLARLAQDPLRSAAASNGDD